MNPRYQSTTTKVSTGVCSTRNYRPMSLHRLSGGQSLTSQVEVWRSSTRDTPGPPAASSLYTGAIASLGIMEVGMAAIVHREMRISLRIDHGCLESSFRTAQIPPITHDPTGRRLEYAY